ncbi:MAG TPA: trypsin-like peptidase domain-containing protein [Myxococcota bacterium]|nr:trypsin-like peptidase domain-containing protein [Myxococcota bacterium]
MTLPSVARAVLAAALLAAWPAGAESPPAADPTPAADIPSSVENGVVKVFSTTRYPDPFKPWTKASPQEITGSGVVIDGKRILTNAHVVSYASQVQIQANQAGDKLPATVEAIAPGIDLALLKLDDESFFKSHPPVPRAKALPDIKDAVLAYGYPTGGSSLSVTKGIISRIEYVPYSVSTSGLRIQIDAALNPGNSGGPAIANDKIVGLAFSHLGGDTQNIGYIIPNEEIDLFLADIADGHYDGKYGMYDELQTLENPALRAYLKLDKSVAGIVVHRPYKTESSYPLREWDVITKIGDTPVDDQGMVKLGTTLRVNFRYLIAKTVKDGKVPLTVIREGKSVAVSLPVSTSRALLIHNLNGDYPSYFIYGPLVFSRASQEFLMFMDHSPQLVKGFAFIQSPLVTEAGNAPDDQLQDLVIVSSPFFPHKLATGYGNPSAGVVDAVNGTKVRSLEQMVALLRDLKDEFVVFKFSHRNGESLVFKRSEIVAATDEILSDNGVRAQASPELMAIWQGKN